MNMYTHKKLLGAFYIVLGFLHIFLAALGHFVLWRVFDFARVPYEVYNIVRAASTGIVALVLITSILAIVGGVGMLKFKSWAKILLLALGCVYIFLFPIGTIVGIYTIVVFVSEKEEPAHQAGSRF